MGYVVMTIASNEAIADSGSTQIFVMDGIPVHNKQKTSGNVDTYV